MAINRMFKPASFLSSAELDWEVGDNSIMRSLEPSINLYLRGVMAPKPRLWNESG